MSSSGNLHLHNVLRFVLRSLKLIADVASAVNLRCQVLQRLRLHVLVEIRYNLVDFVSSRILRNIRITLIDDTSHRVLLIPYARFCNQIII